MKVLHIAPLKLKWQLWITQCVTDESVFGLWITQCVTDESVFGLWITQRVTDGWDRVWTMNYTVCNGWERVWTDPSIHVDPCKSLLYCNSHNKWNCNKCCTVIPMCIRQSLRLFYCRRKITRDTEGQPKASVRPSMAFDRHTQLSRNVLDVLNIFSSRLPDRCMAVPGGL